MNEKKVTLTLGAEDALMLQALLRNERATFAQSGNTPMVQILDRVETAFEDARVRPLPVQGDNPWDRVGNALGDED